MAPANNRFVRLSRERVRITTGWNTTALVLRSARAAVHNGFAGRNGIGRAAEWGEKRPWRRQRYQWWTRSFSRPCLIIYIYCSSDDSGRSLSSSLHISTYLPCQRSILTFGSCLACSRMSTSTGASTGAVYRENKNERCASAFCSRHLCRFFEDRFHRLQRRESFPERRKKRPPYKAAFACGSSLRSIPASRDVTGATREDRPGEPSGSRPIAIRLSLSHSNPSVCCVTL